MKNPNHESKKPPFSLAAFLGNQIKYIKCKHNYKPNGRVCSNWHEDWPWIRLPAKCCKCGKEKEVHSSYFEEWPDDLIDHDLIYVYPA